MMKENEQENEKRDTVADIVATVRRAAQYYEGEAEKSKGLLRESFKLSAANYREIANLVEAAAKRDEARAVEHATHHAEAVARDNCRDCVHNPKGKNYEGGGNAAAMREACVNIAGYAQTAKCHTEDGHILGYLDQIEKWAKSALSEPARNCDLYATATEALKAQDVAFNEDNFKNGECRLGCPGCDDGLIDCKILWLFATAEERKGEGDGK